MLSIYVICCNRLNHERENHQYYKSLSNHVLKRDRSSFLFPLVIPQLLLRRPQSCSLPPSLPSASVLIRRSRTLPVSLPHLISQTMAQKKNKKKNTPNTQCIEKRGWYEIKVGVEGRRRGWSDLINSREQSPVEKDEVPCRWGYLPVKTHKVLFIALLYTQQYNHHEAQPCVCAVLTSLSGNIPQHSVQPQVWSWNINTQAP